MDTELIFKTSSICFDEHYKPASSTRITTNFANLARGERRQENLRNTLAMINNRFNALAHWDNPNADRYSVDLNIVSVSIDIDGEGGSFPTLEILKTTIVDHLHNQRIEGVVGNNLSSYVRDYDFSVVLSKHNKHRNTFSLPENYGDLHGKLFKAFLSSPAYKKNFRKPPIICLSVSSSKTYCRTENVHPVLGVEYQQNDYSLTDAYFAKMGLAVRYFMPTGSAAPLAFYFRGDLLSDYTNLELISTIATMETFQKIYRPEIYNANAGAGKYYKPSLDNQDYSLTKITYDREERRRLGVEQGKFAEEHFIKPYKDFLEKWATTHAA
jgi:hypothetical protein